MVAHTIEPCVYITDGGSPQIRPNRAKSRPQHAGFLPLPFRRHRGRSSNHVANARRPELGLRKLPFELVPNTRRNILRGFRVTQ